MRRVFIAVVLLSASSVFAQKDFKGVWRMPTNMKDYCLNLEQGILMKYKSVHDLLKPMLDPNWTGDRRATRESIASLEESQQKDEESWSRLACAAILYPAK
jgi:hypothetical protein